VEAITDEVMQIIARELKIPPERLAPDTALQDLGVESLDLIEIIFALEEKFDISIPITRMRRRSPTVGTPRRADWENLKLSNRFPRR
jgi:acyl carrier protein